MLQNILLANLKMAGQKRFKLVDLVPSTSVRFLINNNIIGARLSGNKELAVALYLASKRQ